MIHSHLDAFSAASMMFLMALFLCSPLIPKSLRALHNDWPANPRQPTSMGRQRVFHPLLRHSPLNSLYLALFRSNASSIWSSQGTVSSCRTTCLDDSENRTRSGLSEAVAMVSGNLSCLPRSTFSCQSRAVARSPPAEFLLPGGVSPALTNVITRCVPKCVFQAPGEEVG